MIESICFKGVTYTPSEFAAFQTAHPEAFLPPAPTLDQTKDIKRGEIHNAYAQALAPGVEAMPTAHAGKRFSLAEQSITRFDGAIRAAELAGLTSVPYLYTIDDAKIADIPLATAKEGLLACWNAAAQADERLRARLAAIDAATTAEAVEAITW